MSAFSRSCVVLLLSVFSTASLLHADEKKTPLPKNLAHQATASATSEYSGSYLAKNVVDGVVPEALSRSDLNTAWCVKGDRTNDQAELTLTWPEPVALSELLYFGRTAWQMEECWKDYELYINGDSNPAVRGTFKKTAGPQRVGFPKQVVSTVRFRFLNSYGGPNAGASEIMAFAESLTEKQMDRLLGLEVEIPDWLPDSCRRMLLIQRHSITPSHVYTYHSEGWTPGGSLWLMEIGDDNVPKLTKLLDSPDGQLLDMDLSFDAEELLFSWKRGGRPHGDQFNRSLPPDLDPTHMYQVCRMDLSTGEHVELTGGDSNNFNASWLPDGGIVFLSDRKPAFAYCFVTTSPTLYRMDGDGTNVQRLSANYLNDFTPHVMHDGRVLYSRWEYVDRPAIPIQSLWSINPDGTGLSGVFGNRVLSPATFMEARTIPGSNKILCVMTSHNGPCRGAIGLIDRSKGPNAQEAIVNLTPDVKVDPVDVGDGNRMRGPYENPMPVDEEFFLVSKGGTILVRSYAGDKEAALVRPKDGMGFYSPTPIVTRNRPPVVASSLPADAEKAGPWATLTMQDVYVGLEPHVKRGEIKQLAIVQEVEKSRWAPQSTDGRNTIACFGFQFPLVSCGATYAPKRLWGFATVEEDGSANFKVPAGLPIYFMAIDEEGRALQRMRSFTHLMPGERQGCVGCHADRNTILSTNVTGRGDLPIAFQREPETLATPEWGSDGRFSFHRVVQPVLDTHCIKCHNVTDLAGGIDLSGDRTDFFSVAYESLARKGTYTAFNWINRGAHGQPNIEAPYVSWISTYNGHEANILEVTPKRWGSPASKLAEMIRAGHLDENGEARVTLSDMEKRRLFTWMDLNVPYYSTSSSNHYDAMGCRRIYPPKLDETLNNVASRRCASCHENGLPRDFYTRIENPEKNDFLLAPLAAAAGGKQLCGEAVFESTDDPDYKAILNCFKDTDELLNERPRMDMLESPAEYDCPTCPTASAP